MFAAIYRNGGDQSIPNTTATQVLLDTVSFDVGGIAWGHSPLNWRMLYHWGQWCDELVSSFRVRIVNGINVCHGESEWAPRFAVNTVPHTHEDMVTLRETLRMHCLSWQSRDPRYRTSYPGV